MHNSTMFRWTATLALAGFSLVSSKAYAWQKLQALWNANGTRPSCAGTYTYWAHAYGYKYNQSTQQYDFVTDVISYGTTTSTAAYNDGTYTHYIVEAQNNSASPFYSLCSEWPPLAAGGEGGCSYYCGSNQWVGAADALLCGTPTGWPACDN
jgi:hypothetical protein